MTLLTLSTLLIAPEIGSSTLLTFTVTERLHNSQGEVSRETEPGYTQAPVTSNNPPHLSASLLHRLC